MEDHQVASWAYDEGFILGVGGGDIFEIRVQNSFKHSIRPI